MEKKPIDRRVKKTKHQLRLALMSLMSEKPVNSISVRELAERADINRGTFYMHYKDVNDLLQQLEDELAQKVIDICVKFSVCTPQEHASRPILRELCQLAFDNADLVKVFLGVNGNHAYTARICEIFRSYFLDDYAAKLYPEDECNIRLNYYCSFVVAGFLKVILTWLESGTKESPDEMADIIGDITINGFGMSV